MRYAGDTRKLILEITVRDDDIAQGVPGDPHQCPLARAIAHAMAEQVLEPPSKKDLIQVSVYRSHIMAWRGKVTWRSYHYLEALEAEMPEALLEFVNQYDKDQKPPLPAPFRLVFARHRLE